MRSLFKHQMNTAEHQKDCICAWCEVERSNAPANADRAPRFTRVGLPDSVIPSGIYCYDEKGICPYWHLFKSMPDKDNGYCHFLKSGDWEAEGLSLLWDQVKECGINDDTNVEQTH